MPYDMHRVFVATPLGLEDERLAAHEAIADFNKDVAMPSNILMVTVSLPPHMADKSSFESAIVDNIRGARYYVLILEDSWGPASRNFERDFAIAQKCARDGSHTTREAFVLFKKPLLPHRVDADIVALKQSLGSKLVEFDSPAELKALLLGMLGKWLPELVEASSPQPDATPNTA